MREPNDSPAGAITGARWLAITALAGAIVAASSLAPAAALLGGFGGPGDFGTGEEALNDDGSSMSIDLTTAFPRGLNFYGRMFSAVFVNNNGNITFNAGLSTYTPTPFPVASQPMIAPWWGDVDTRGSGRPGRNGVWWDVRPGQFTATWFNVGYYNTHDDKQNSFQLILRDRHDVADGAFDVEFRYARCEWTTGDASGGMHGLGGTPAQAGFDAGNTHDFYAIPGSRTMGVLGLCTSSNVGIPGVWRFPIRPGNDTMRAQGDPCMANSQCTSNLCVDGVCCNAACAGQCEACIVPGFIGQCVPVVGQPIGSRAGCTGATGTCGNVCDGVNRMGCTMATATTVCIAGSCAGGIAVTPVTCGSALMCGQPTNHDCGLFSCGLTACLSACTGDLDCAASGHCVGGACVARPSCASGTCAAGEVCVSGGCIALRPVGSTCANPTDCSSAFCVDGRCSPFGTVSGPNGGDAGPQIYTGDGLASWNCAVHPGPTRRSSIAWIVGAAAVAIARRRRR